MNQGRLRVMAVMVVEVETCLLHVAICDVGTDT